MYHTVFYSYDYLNINIDISNKCFEKSLKFQICLLEIFIKLFLSIIINNIRIDIKFLRFLSLIYIIIKEKKIYITHRN